MNLPILFHDAIPEHGCDYFTVKKNIMQLANIQSFGFACKLISEAEEYGIIRPQPIDGKKWYQYVEEKA